MADAHSTGEAMTLTDLQRACEAATPLEKVMLARDRYQIATAVFSQEFGDDFGFYIICREAVPKLLVFVQAWDRVEAVLQDKQSGSEELGVAEDQLEAARKALEE